MSMLAKIKSKLKGWKTVAWNSLVGISGIALYMIDQLQTVDFSKVFMPSTVGWLMLGLSVAGILLRAVTTTQIGAK
jgi:hypothetical protein